jgi:hypothetical protein
MTFKWVRGRNPYRLNHFGTLQIGPQVKRAAIAASRKNLVAKLRRGKPHIVAGHQLTEAEVQAAEARLLRDESWAEEVLLVHPMPGGESPRLPEVSRAVLAATEPPRPPHRLRLSNLAALVPLLPGVHPPDLPWPEWEELGVPGPGSAADIAADIQFDL